MNERKNRYRVYGKPAGRQTIPTLKIDNKPTDIKIRLMHFDDSQFHEGLNTTVRLGDKWYNFLNVGEFFRVQGWDGYAKVRELQLRKFVQCNDWHILAKEHNPDCRDFKGLREGIGKAYPEFATASKDEQDQAEVTVVGFVLYKPWL